LLFLSGLMGFAGVAQSQPKESTVPELKVNRVPGKVGPRGWSRFSFGEPALFTAVFPRPPQQLTNRVFGNDGASTLWLFLAANDTALYQIIWAVGENVPITRTEKERVRDYNNFATGFVDGLVKTGRVKGGEITAERVIRPRGIEGFERDISFTDHDARLQMFHVGKSWLAVVSVWNSDNKLEERKLFFDSVKLEVASSPLDGVALKAFLSPAMAICQSS
jgi:hypothetical protein